MKLVSGSPGASRPTDLPIGEIASALSYSVHGSFVRAFKKRSGKTPSQWREEYAVGARGEDA